MDDLGGKRKSQNRWDYLNYYLKSILGSDKTPRNICANSRKISEDATIYFGKFFYDLVTLFNNTHNSKCDYNKNQCPIYRKLCIFLIISSDAILAIGLYNLKQAGEVLVPTCLKLSCH